MREEWREGVNEWFRAHEGLGVRYINKGGEEGEEQYSEMKVYMTNINTRVKSKGEEILISLDCSCQRKSFSFLLIQLIHLYEAQLSPIPLYQATVSEFAE